jgi:hypothetical protein
MSFENPLAVKRYAPTAKMALDLAELRSEAELLEARCSGQYRPAPSAGSYRQFARFVEDPKAQP